MFDPTKPVQTRDGRKARIVDTNYDGGYILAVVAYHDAREFINMYFSDGRACTNRDSDLDLINIPEPRESFINVYPTGRTNPHSSLEAANRCCDTHRLGVMKITVTGNKITAEQVA